MTSFPDHLFAMGNLNLVKRQYYLWRVGYPGFFCEDQSSLNVEK